MKIITLFFLLINLKSLGQKKTVFNTPKMSDSTGLVFVTKNTIYTDAISEQSISPEPIKRGTPMFVVDYFPSSRDKDIFETIFNGDFVFISTEDALFQDSLITYLNKYVVNSNDSLRNARRIAAAREVDNLLIKKQELVKQREGLKQDMDIANAKLYGLSVNDYGIEKNEIGYLDFNIQIGNFKKGKVVKYVWLTAKTIDRVKGEVETKTFKLIGPIEFGHYGSTTFNNGFSHENIVETVRLSNIKLEYMDGSFANFSGKVLSDIIMTNPVQF